MAVDITLLTCCFREVAVDITLLTCCFRVVALDLTLLTIVSEGWLWTSPC